MQGAVSYTWQEHEAFHLGFCQALYCRELRRLPVGLVYVPNEFDEPGVLLFGGKNRTYPIERIIASVREVGAEVGQAACFYVTPTWEDAEAAPAQLQARGCFLEAAIHWYHLRLETAGYALPKSVELLDSVDVDEFKHAYEAAFDGMQGWRPFVGMAAGPAKSGVQTRMIYLGHRGHLVAFAGIAWEGNKGQLFAVGVPVAERGKGYGTMVVQQCLNLLAAYGVTHSVVGILDSNEVSIRLHEGVGFRRFAKTECWELGTGA